MLRILLPTALLSVLALSSCAEQSSAIVATKQAVVENEASEPTKILDKRAPKTKCRKMPPVNRSAVLKMLIKKGSISSSMTIEQQQQVVTKYIQKNIQRYQSTC